MRRPSVGSAAKMASGVVVVSGTGLQTGQPSRVVLRARPGPLALGPSGRAICVDELSVASTDWTTTVDAGGALVRTVEHVLAACGGLGIYEGLAVEIDGPELPWLDGAAMRWCEALDDFRLAASRPRLRVLRDDAVTVDRSRYAFARGPKRIEVLVDYDDARLAPRAAWSGDADEFRAHIAPARSFALERDLGPMIRAKLGASVTPESVVLVTPDRIFAAGRPFEADEPARHKLLDLVGDMVLYGGPPDGVLVAERPGHRATHEAMRLALERKIVCR
jgi:UDP-3-O-[3-hydroxymyristoyl] N-acetylglucosamine deacetylase